MTAHNSAAFIGAAVESLQDQTRTDWELIVVDDGSTDSTASIIEQVARSDHRIRLICQERAGVSRARNVGLAAAGPSRYVALLDSDDCYLPDSLQRLVAALDDRPDAVGVFGLAEYMDQTGRAVRPGEHPARQLARRAVRRLGLIDVEPGVDSTFADLSVAGAIWPAAVGLHRSSIIRTVDGFDTSFTRQGDWELYLRMSRFGPFAVVGEQVAWYRQHGSNLTADVVASCYQQERVRRKAWTSSANTRAQRRVVARGARRLGLADFRRTGYRLAAHARTKQIRAAAADAVSLAFVTATLCRPGPPKPSLRRVRWVRTSR